MALCDSGNSEGPGRWRSGLGTGLHAGGPGVLPGTAHSPELTRSRGEILNTDPCFQRALVLPARWAQKPSQRPPRLASSAGAVGLPATGVPTHPGLNSGPSAGRQRCPPSVPSFLLTTATFAQRNGGQTSDFTPVSVRASEKGPSPKCMTSGLCTWYSPQGGTEVPMLLGEVIIVVYGIRCQEDNCDTEKQRGPYREDERAFLKPSPGVDVEICWSYLR